MDKLTLDVNMNNLSQAERDTLLALVNKASKPKWEGPQGNFIIHGDGDIYITYSQKAINQQVIVVKLKLRLNTFVIN